MNNNITDLEMIGKGIALAGLKIGAIKIRPEKPILWASKTYNPIYNDNRMFLFYQKYRRLVIEGFSEVLDNLSYIHDESLVIAGTSTSGIPWATILSEEFDLPLIYIRDKPKDHGLRNQIEGIDDEKDLEGKKVILIEDLISTGSSSVAAVDAIRKANGVCNLCLSIFNYGLPKPPKMFSGEIPYKDDKKLESPCKVTSLLYYPQLLSIGIENGYIKKEEEEVLLEWMEDQPNWGEKHGFPPEK